MAVSLQHNKRNKFNPLKIKDMKATEKSKFAAVKEIEARRPQKLTKEYCEKYLNAIRDLLSGGNDITKEEAEEYFITPSKLDEEYTRIYWKVFNYLENHF